MEINGRLNFFFPYERAPAWHENQLTRALLVVLRYCPMAHQVWFSLVAPDRSLHALPKADFATQRQQVFERETDHVPVEAVTGISVWLAPDAAQIAEIVKPSDRQQVLDAVITYGDELIVVIENKISFGNVTEQPHRINDHGAPIKWIEKPQSVAWQTLLAALADLVEHSLVSGAEQLLIADFLELVEAYFPQIGPYSTLARCGAHVFRLTRRLDTVLGRATGLADSQELGRRDLNSTGKVAMAYLKYEPTNSTVCLRFYPGDTLSQARDLYHDPAAVQAVLALRSDGWHIEPGFHWGFMSKGYAWSQTPTTVDAYCAFWEANIEGTRELQRAEWEAYWERLVEAGIVDATDKQPFDLAFTFTQRMRAHPRPGLSCQFSWPMLEAQQLDVQDSLIEEVRSRIDQMMTALGTASR